MFDGSVWTTYDMGDGLVDNTVKYISSDDVMKVFFATGAGLSVLDWGTWNTYTSANGLPNDDVTYISRQPDGSPVWIATMMGGVIQYSSGTGFYGAINTTNTPDLPDNNVFAVLEDANHDVWIGTWYGITRLAYGSVFIANYDSTSGLPNEYIRDLKEDSYGDIWIGMFSDYNTDGAVSCYNGLGFTNFRVSDGLADDQVIRLAVDQNDDVWVATGNGVTKISGVSSLHENAKLVAPSVYPNPASDKVTLTNLSYPSKLSVTDMAGSCIFEKEINGASCELETSAWQSGIYILRVISDEGVSTVKLMIR
jgi:ligand-binding sensor domain-containing protein